MIVVIHVGVAVVKLNCASRPGERKRLTNNLSPMTINAQVTMSPIPEDEKVVLEGVVSMLMILYITGTVV